MSRALLVAAFAALAAIPPGAAAHEILHTVERGRAIAVHAHFPDGEDLAYCEYEVFSPADGRIAHQKGRTDRSGWLAFVPDSPGSWRVKIADATGHGIELYVDAATAAEPRGTDPLSSLSFVLRPIAGIVAIGAVFAALLALHRRKGASP